LILNRTDGMGWAFPGGVLKDGETPEKAAWRECWEETGHRCGGLQFLMQRTKDDGQGLVNFHTYISDCPDEFVPTLNHEHSSYGWFDADETFTDNRPDSARADSTPVVGGEGHAELEATLAEGMLQDERERVAGQDQDLEGELASAASEGPEPSLETPAYPPPLAGEDQDLLGEDEPDEPDLDDETLDLIASVIGDLEARLERLEEGARD
jgi:hypothetical protein